MYGDATDEERRDRADTPLGVSIIITILLVCGLALALLPLTVYVFGAEAEKAPIVGPVQAEREVTSPPSAVARAVTTSATLAPLPVADPDPDADAGAADDASAAVPHPETRGPFDLPEGWDELWEPWFAHVDWIIGPEAGMAAARESGKPMLLFYTATW